MDTEEHNTGSVQMVLVSALIGGVMFMVAQGGFFDGLFQREILLSIEPGQHMVLDASDMAIRGIDVGQTAAIR